MVALSSQETSDPIPYNGTQDAMCSHMLHSGKTYLMKMD